MSHEEKSSSDVVRIGVNDIVNISGQSLGTVTDVNIRLSEAAPSSAEDQYIEGENVDAGREEDSGQVSKMSSSINQIDKISTSHPIIVHTRPSSIGRGYQTRIARRWKGVKARWVVKKLLIRRFHSARLVQCSWRKFQARRQIAWLIYRHKFSISIQRICRGHRDRRKASNEREKYIFSRSQSGGIEIGRRLLAEHKRTATRLL